MIELRIEEGMLLATLQLTHKNKTIELKRALIDTGSTGTIVSADQAATIGIVPEENDSIYRISGVGGERNLFTQKL